MPYLKFKIMEDELNVVDKKDIRLETIRKINDLKLPVYIWGGTNTGRMMAAYLKENGMKGEVQYVVDDEYLTGDDGFIPLSIYLKKYAQNSVMVFGFYNYKIIQEKKLKYGKIIKHLYDFHFVRVCDDWLRWNVKEICQYRSGFEKTYNMFCDERSKQTMEMYIDAAIYGRFDELFSECYVSRQYFNELTENAGIDVLVDCGAYDGDSIHDYVGAFSNYKKIYAFEPDDENRGKLVRRICEEKIDKVEVIPKGVYSESTTLKFTSDGNASSYFDDNGDISIEVLALDEVLKNEHGNIMIKMDIEGSELDALKGAATTITSKKPTLAVCVYHKEADLAIIPQYIDSLVESGTYDYKLRFHGVDLVELVFYAIPK